MNMISTLTEIDVNKQHLKTANIGSNVEIL